MGVALTGLLAHLGPGTQLMVTPEGSRSGVKLPLGRLYKIRPCSSSADVIVEINVGNDGVPFGCSKPMK
jgi:hypothetical protein